MKGDPKVLRHLNQVLRNELTAINQYFLHARMCKNWGFEELNEHEYKASIKAMKLADDIIERILFLEGLPNLQDLGKLILGEDVEEIFKGDYQLDTEAREDLVAAIAEAEALQDYISRELLEKLLEVKEERIDWLETQISLISNIGLPNYLQSTLDD
ncbi:bacterioferritin [Pontibacterium sp. N1Y112]|uniref:Bacterioferritin n=1 Tax=Pontibacterium sinense TaxID=2781979 RepID=A0A8J7FAE3_9GAMM|nr:bacterioferritin [Pontibacterium sinense]MBE9397262.1 bacterioferritin [Pontibacterium sinense]